MKLDIYYDRMRKTSKLKLIPKAPKKINPRNYEFGIISAQENTSLKFRVKNAKMELFNQDFIAGSDTELAAQKLEIIG